MIVSAYLVNIIDLPSVAILSRSVSTIERHTEQQDAFIEAEAQTQKAEVTLRDSSLVSHGQTLFRAGALVIAFSISAPVIWLWNNN